MSCRPRFEFVEAESLPQHGGSSQDFIGLLANSIQTIADCFFHTLRDKQLADIATFPAAAFTPHRALFDQGFQNLFHKKRIALRFAMHGVTKIRADIFTQQRAQLR